MKKRSPSRRWDRQGVSEIIANLLILAITVTLFSSVLWFVTSMPPPKQEVYTDFSATTEIQPSGKCWINVTNQGGQVLDDFRTRIYVFVDEDTIALNFSDSAVDIGPTWVTGETWVYDNLTGITASTRLGIMIIDYVSNSMVWSSVLRGQEGAFPPIIGERGTTPLPSYDGDPIRFYATVMDPDGNLRVNSVFVNATSIGISSPIQLTDSNNDGVFVSVNQYTADIDWNGKIVTVNATDQTNKKATARITLDIQLKPGGGQTQYGPYYNYSAYFINGTYPPDAAGGESGGQSGTAGTTFYYIRKYVTPAVITRNFNASEQVLIEVWSDTLRNLAIENSFHMIDPLTGNYVTPPTSVDAFGYGGIYGTFHRYTFNFSAPSTAYIYPFVMRLRDNVGTVVSISDYIIVDKVTYPRLETYRVDSVTGNLVRTDTFNHTDTVYLKIITKDVDDSVTNVLVGDIEVSDYSGRYIVKKLPPTANAYPANPAYSAPLSSLFKTSAGAGSPNRVPDTNLAGVYTFKIVLRDAYQGWWLPRINSYTLVLSEIADTGDVGTPEDYFSLSIQFNVSAPLSTTDLVAAIGSGSYTWSSSGASWSENSLAWFKGGERSDQWSKVVIDSNTKNGPIGMAVVDVDGDSYKDVIVGWQDQSVSVGWYKNLKVDGSQWSTVPYVIAPAFDELADIQNAGGTDRGNANEDVTVYATRNNGFQTNYYSVNEIASGLAMGDFDGDGDQDLVVSMVHSVVYTTATGSGNADYTNSFGMFFNRGIYVYYNDGSWGTGTKYALEGTLTWLSGTGDSGANGNNNPAAMDVQTGDFNKDGYDDIAAVYQDGTTDVWLNQFGKLAGNMTYRESNAFASNSLISNLPTVPGESPWDDIQGQNGRIAKLRIADINKDGYPDIIRTSTVGSGVGGVDSNIYVFYTKQATTNSTAFPSAESHVYGTAAGSLGDLAAVDNHFENLTESRATSNDIGYPNKAGNDTTGDTIADLNVQDGTYYLVQRSGLTPARNTMSISGFALNSANSAKTVATARLSISWYVGSSYAGTNWVKVSFDGVTWTNIVRPLSSHTTLQSATIDLIALNGGPLTYGQLQNLKVGFVNNDGSSSGTRSVYFDFLVEQVTFNEAMALDWTWMIANDPSYPFHTLTVNGYRLDSSESFNVTYSIDNVNWVNLGTVSSTSPQNYTWSLPYHSGPFYYVRVVDYDRHATDSTASTLCLNMVRVLHSPADVWWLASDERIVTINGIGSGEFVTAIAVGDIGKSWGDYKADSYPDLVVATSKVGNADTTHTLFVILQQSGGGIFETPLAVDTSLLASKVGNNNAIYDTKDVELGDFNGDKNLDIVLVIGFAPGRTGTGVPSLFSYSSRPDLGPAVFYEATVNALDISQSVINVETGYIDLSILLPLFGVLGIMIAGTATDRRRRGQG
jgi:hypothetical protein